MTIAPSATRSPRARSDAPRLRPLEAATALSLLRRFDAALDVLERAGETAGRRRLLRLGAAFGRYRVVARLQSLLPPAERLSPERYRRFLRRRAVPAVRMGGDAARGFWLDEASIDAIARELGEPTGPLCAATVRWMQGRGSRLVAKQYVLARLSGDRDLIDATERAVEARAAQPRARLAERVSMRLRPLGIRVRGVIQVGDTDDFNPKSAWIFDADCAGAPVIVKENLRLPTDYARVDGTSKARELLGALRHPRLVALIGVAEDGPDELLVLRRAAGSPLTEHVVPEGLLPAQRALGIGAQLAELLAWLHAHGVLYLDGKPANVLFDGRNATQIDLGMARRLRPGAASAATLTSTPGYVPPEVARCFRGRPGSDVFQLGLLLYELLVGRPAFAPLDPEAVAADLDLSPAGLGIHERALLGGALAIATGAPDLDAEPLGRCGVRQLLGRMLAPRSTDRPPAAEVATALGRLAR